MLGHKRGANTYMEKKIWERDYSAHHISGFILLIVAALLLAPLIHELFHILFLDVNHKNYDAWVTLSPQSGLHGEIKLFDEMDTLDAVILLSLGIFSNLAISAIFFLISWLAKIQKKTHESIISTYLGVGFLYNPLMYFFEPEGDLMNIMKLIDLDRYSLILPAVGLIILAATMLYVHEHAKDVFWGQDEDKPQVSLNILNVFR